jgi:hypothetical protein
LIKLLYLKKLQNVWHRFSPTRYDKTIVPQKAAKKFGAEVAPPDMIKLLCLKKLQKKFCAEVAPPDIKILPLRDP